MLAPDKGDERAGGLPATGVELGVVNTVPFAGSVEVRVCDGLVMTAVAFPGAALDGISGTVVPDVGCTGGGMVCPMGPPPPDGLVVTPAVIDSVVLNVAGIPEAYES